MPLSEPYETNLSPSDSKPTLTPLMIAMNGHIAIMLRRFCNDTGMSVPDFHQHVLEINRNATTAYPWLAGTNRPSQIWAEKMSHMLGVPLHFFTPHDPDNGDPPEQPTRWRVPATWGQRHAGTAVVPVKAPGRPTAATSVLMPSRPSVAPAAKVPAGPRPVLSFQLFEDDTSMVQVHAHLPGDQGKSLLRVLLEAGLTNHPVPPEDHEDG